MGDLWTVAVEWWALAVLLGAWAAPRTWVAGAVLTAAQLNVDVRDNMGVLKTNIADNGDVDAATLNSQAAAFYHAHEDANTTQAGTDADTNEKTLGSYSLPGGSLGAIGDYVTVRAWGTFAANANEKTVRIKFGSATLAACPATAVQNGNTWWAEMTVIRTGAATQDAFGHVSYDASGINDIIGTAGAAAPTETLSGAVTIAVTGQNGTGAANDILFEGMVINVYKA